MIAASKKDNMTLDQVPYICYLIWFKKNEVQSKIDSDSKVNAMTPAYIWKLDLKVRFTNVGA